MRKLICNVLIVTLLLVMLTGCGNIPTDQTGTGTDCMTESSETSGRPTESIPEEAPEVAPTEMSPEVPRPSILDDGVLVEETTNLYRIPNEIVEQGMNQMLYEYQGEWLTVYSIYDMSIGSSRMHIKLFSVETGEVIREAEFTGIGYAAAQVFEDRIAVFDSVNGTAYILDESLQLIDEYSLEGWSVYFDPAITKAYCFNSEQQFQVVDLNSGLVKDMLPGKKDIYALKANKNDVTFGYTDLDSQLTGIGTLDLETGEVSFPEIEGAVLTAENEGDFWLVGLYREERGYLLGRADELCCFEQKEFSGMPKLLGGSCHVLLNTVDQDGNLIVELYDSEGRFLSAFAKSDVYAGMICDPMWLEEFGGYLLVIPDQAGAEYLYFWDIEAEVQGEDLTLAADNGDDEIIGSAVAAELYEQAGRIAAEFGVEVRIADLADTEFVTYVAEQNFDEVLIRDALYMLEKVLRSYPEGFIDQLYHGDYRRIEIQLTGALGYKDSDQPFVGSVIGFTEPVWDKFIVALDISWYDLERTLYHEFSHVIEDKLQFDAGCRKDALFSEEHWDSFNPEWFEYFGYVDVYPEFTGSYEYSLYFIDGYAGTYPGEDRGRIMEYAAAGNTARFIGYPGIAEKLEYYCRCIRDAFDTVGWPERTIWEQTLDRVR